MTTIINKLKSLMSPEIEAKADVKYAVAIPTTETPHFYGRNRSAALLKKYRTIYQEGGIYTTAVNTYPDFILKDGYHFEGDDPNLVAAVEQWSKNFNFYEVIYEAIIDSLVYGDSYDEIIYGKAGNKVLGISGRQSWLFETVYDSYNVVLGYKQFVDGFSKSIEIPTNNIVHLRLLGMSGAPFGISLIGNSYDEILRDTEIAESSATAIKRHGFPIWQIKVGQSGESVPDAVLDDLEYKFADIQSKHEIITQYDVEILPLNSGGVSGLDVIQKFSIERCLSSMGIPMECIGLGSQTSTYATASVTLEAFNSRISRMRRTIEYAYNTQVIDKVTGIPGAVRLVLDSPMVDGSLEEE